MNNCPRVSICVPSQHPALPAGEDSDTIFAQTLQDWELIVVDSYSDDGSWEYIKELAANEPRMKISQAPRGGIYSGLNDCLKSAQGDFIYIATSDDTMCPGCLEKMVEALDANPDCGLCQCALVFIDAASAPLPAEQQWDHASLGRYDPDLVSKRNKRLAPHDGLVHPALLTIYTSMTQLLIRRKVFDRVGLFDGRWGSISDFEWEMRAGLVENCIYIPEKLATWRLHPLQATQNADTPEIRLREIEMARAAFERAKGCRGPLLEGVRINDFLYFLERDVVAMEYGAAKGKGEKLRVLLRHLFHRPRAARDQIIWRMRAKTRGPWDYEGRHQRLRAVLEKYAVPAPVLG